MQIHPNMPVITRSVTPSFEFGTISLDRCPNTKGGTRNSGRFSKSRCGGRMVPKGRPSRDMSGPFEIQWMGSAVMDGVTVFSFRVKGSDAQHVMHRRYSDFVELSNGLQNALATGLPDVPPKSFFRRQMLSSFRTHREAALGDLLRAAVVFDPEATTVELRKFLGLSAGSDISLEDIYAIPESTGSSLCAI